jgi:hypothetical protein
VFLQEKAGSAKPSDIIRFLDKAANEPPQKGDEIS